MAAPQRSQEAVGCEGDRRAWFASGKDTLFDRVIEQLELALEEIEVSEVQAKPSAEHADPATGPLPVQSKRSRQPLPDHLLRESVVHAAPCVCPDCGGGQFLKAGEDVSEVLDYVPASFRVVRHVRPRFVCRNWDAFVQAPRPHLPVERGKPGAGLLAHVLKAAGRSLVTARIRHHRCRRSRACRPRLELIRQVMSLVR